MRAIVFLLFVILVFLIVRFTLNRVIKIREQNREKQRIAQNQQASAAKPEPQSMVRCAECGVHLPQSEAFYDGQDTFCSEGHMQEFHAKSQDKNTSDHSE